MKRKYENPLFKIFQFEQDVLSVSSEVVGNGISSSDDVFDDRLGVKW